MALSSKDLSGEIHSEIANAFYNVCRFSKEYCYLIFDRISTPYHLLFYASVTCENNTILELSLRANYSLVDGAA